MTSTAKVVNGNPTNNGHLGKRKKSREIKGSYLNKWLDKTFNFPGESTPSMETYDFNINSNMNWLPNNSHPPNFDQYRFGVYGYSQEPMSLPTIPTYYPNMGAYYPDSRYVRSANKSVQVQRPRRRRIDSKPEDVTNAVNGGFNSNYLHTKTFTDSQDFASLPPIVTSVGDTNSIIDLNGTEKEDERRFSDPCIQGLPDVAQGVNGEADTGSVHSSESGSQVGSKLLTCLLDQITTLKMANERLNRDLQETKLELQSVRQQNMLWQKGAASIGASPNHSPHSNGVLGPSYAPGVVTDVVREIREAARIREEALYARVRSMVLERNESSGLGGLESKLSERSLEDIKSSIRASEADKRRMLDRIAKLEDELRMLRVANGLDSAEVNGNREESDSERVRLRKELADMKRARLHAEEHSHKLERLVTQLRSKFNGLQVTSPNGPESLPTSEPEHEQSRARRTSVNSNTTVVFGPVTDL